MGGAGKTTLARNIYENKLIAEHFHTRSWVTISQEYVVREVLIEILLCQKTHYHRSKEELNEESEEDLGIRLYQSLIGRKYLIVMDDVWSIEVWDKLKSFVPDNNNGSRIMITTRLSKLAFDLAASHSHVVKMDRLDENTSWDLFCKKVFVEASCPLELEEIGRTISRNCRGLPLSIVTIGGHLAKFGMTRDYWEYVTENVSSLVNSEDDERCLSILSLSYINLPVHLKPCLLYMGLFREDQKIYAPDLIRLWIAEGFLKPISGKTLEVVGQDCLKDLVERNLVSVHRWESTGNISYCVVHDLVRDLCLREAQKEHFFSVVRIDKLQANEVNNTQRRVAIHRSPSNQKNLFYHGTSCSAPFLRSCIIGSEEVSKWISLRSVRLLRVLTGVKSRTPYRLDDIVPLVNSRFLCLNTNNNDIKYISSLWSMSWNLQTLVINAHMKKTSPLDIWKMPQLRHVKIDSIYLSDPPPSSGEDGGRPLVLENLQTLMRIMNFTFSEEVVKRIPDIKKLRISYKGRMPSMDDYCLDKLGRLQTLEYLRIKFYCQRNWLHGLTLPCSLKKLILDEVKLDNDVMGTMIGGSLPLLTMLKLRNCTFKGDEWNPVEGQFCHLKYLGFSNTNLKHWNNADNAHFPRLEYLKIAGESSLDEFPWGTGDIPTLRLILLTDVRESLIISAKRMLGEQEEEFGNVKGLVIDVYYHRKEQEEMLESLASNNCKVYSYKRSSRKNEK